MGELSDNLLLKGLRSSDQRAVDKALRSLYADNYSVIADFVQKNSGSTEDAADVFQDAIVIFYRKIRLESLELNCAIQTYLYAVSKKLWLYRLRDRKKSLIVDKEIDHILVEDDSLELLMKTEDKAMVAAVMHQLGEGCRQILTYYYFDRLRMKEIAPRMNLANEQVAKNKKAACMKKLRALVEKSPKLKNIFR